MTARSLYMQSFVEIGVKHSSFMKTHIIPCTRSLIITKCFVFFQPICHANMYSGSSQEVAFDAYMVIAFLRLCIFACGFHTFNS